MAAADALKHPLTRYRDRVFQNAKATLPGSLFATELGYVVVAENFRGSGMSQSIVSALTSFASGPHVFATARADRPTMHRTLATTGFQREGILYPNMNGGYDIVLYVRLA